MNMFKGSKRVMSLVAGVIASFVVAAAPVSAVAQATSTNAAQPEGKKEEKKESKKESKKEMGGVTPGATAPDFTLTDTDGKEHSLAKYLKDGKIVVIEWFNPDCPFVKKHHDDNKTMNDLHKKYSDKGVVFLAINSGAPGKQGAGKERNAKARVDSAIPYPVLLDEKGVTGKAYGAKHTPDMFIITPDGTVAYMGAIDDDPTTKIGKVNYVAKALDEILAKKPVTTRETKGYGCSVKYAN